MSIIMQWMLVVVDGHVGWTIYFTVIPKMLFVCHIKILNLKGCLMYTLCHLYKG